MTPVRDYLETLLPEDWNGRTPQERRAYIANDDELLGHPEGKYRRERVCLAEIFIECFGEELKNVTAQERREVMDVMRRMHGWKEIGGSVRFGPYGKQKGFCRRN